MRNGLACWYIDIQLVSSRGGADFEETKKEVNAANQLLIGPPPFLRYGFQARTIFSRTSPKLAPASPVQSAILQVASSTFASLPSHKEDVTHGPALPLISGVLPPEIIGRDE
eukprot:gene10878-16998_t